jgi:hypothetical protein
MAFSPGKQKTNTSEKKSLKHKSNIRDRKEKLKQTASQKLKNKTKKKKKKKTDNQVPNWYGVRTPGGWGFSLGARPTVPSSPIRGRSGPVKGPWPEEPFPRGGRARWGRSRCWLTTVARRAPWKRRRPRRSLGWSSGPPLACEGMPPVSYKNTWLLVFL